MSNKSGVASQTISLPSGGGALQGIGETFSPDLFTGTGNISVPVTVPSGRNGFQPSLNLSYSTGNGNGPFGLGWALNTQEIARKTSRGIPRYLGDRDPGEQDTFLLSGTEDLVPIEQLSAIEQPSPDVTHFRPRTEGLFARIEHHHHEGDFWTVRTKDGLINQYGGVGSPDAVVVDPENPSKIFCWKLTETTDPFGNRIRYDYRRDRGEDGLHAWDQVYLENIRYVDYGDDAFLVSVTFLYENPPNPSSRFSHHRAGFEIRTRLRCKRIEVRTHPPGEDHLVRSIDLVYLDDRVRAGELDSGLLPRNGVSLLSRIHVVGHDGPEAQEMPPLEFGYTAFSPENRLLQRVEGTGNTLMRRSLADDDLELVSLFGNGLPDIVQMNGGTRFWRNLGNGTYDIPRTMPEVPIGVRLSDPGTQFGDLNGNGRADLLTLDREGRGGYFPLSFTGRWSPRGFVRYKRVPLVPLGDSMLRLVDLDGDGVVDALRTGPSFQLFFNDPAEGWNASETRPRGPLEEFPDVNFDNPRVKLADLSGDGLQDIVLIGQRRIDYWPYLGHGRWGARITMSGSPFFDDDVLDEVQFDPRRVLLGDVDGDGLDDIVYVEPDRVTIWINQNGNGWSGPIPIKNTPSFPEIDAVRLVDLLGTGTAGILWTSNSPGSTVALHKFLDLTGAVKPYLLNTMTNNMGAVTHIEYAPSTKFYLEDLQSSTPWQTPLPFPVQVVARTEVIDEISRTKLTTRYHYHHGYWDGGEREFRGFGRVDQLDSEQRVDDFNRPVPGEVETPVDPVDQAHFSPPLLTKIWFHLGPIGDEFTDRSEADFTDEYWFGDPPFLPRPAATSQMLTSLRATQRADALRTLRGHALRTELYALDGSDRQDRPFTVTEFQYGIREISPPTDSDSRRQRIFFPHTDAQRTTQWERGTEPMTQVEFTEDYDDFGLARRHIKLAVPRGRDFRVPVVESSPYLGVSSTTAYAQRNDDLYIADRVASVTKYEIANDGHPAVLSVREAVAAGAAELSVIGQTRNYYDGEPFTGLPFGQLGDFGSLVRTETLVLTDEILNEAYRPEVGGTVIPPYLALEEQPVAWTGDYPQEFRDHTPPHAGYTASAVDTTDTRGYYVQQTRHRYDFHTDPVAGRGSLTGIQDQLGNEALIDYDDIELLPVRVTDAVGMTTEILHDYRMLRPGLITDENGNRTAFTYTPLGLLGSTSVMGKVGEDVGDTMQAPGTRLVYDFWQQPITLRTIRRVTHAKDPVAPPERSDEIIETVEYSDGFGRLIQTRVQAEDVQWGDPLFGSEILPAEQDDPVTQRDVIGQHGGAEPKVVVSGWQVYDNKGRVVEKYDPFCAIGWQYAPPGEAQMPQRVTMHYDPRGRILSTRNPDGSEEQVVYGIPHDLADPHRFTPTPWELYTYDANDNAGRTSPTEASTYRHHWDTPTSTVFDALGRNIGRIERRREPGSDSAVSAIRTEWAYNLLDDLVGVTDALGNSAIRYVHDLTGRPLRVEHLDEGVRRMILDAAGNDIESRDSKGTLVLQAYDSLLRPIRRWARDDADSVMTLREVLEYGDGGEAQQPAEERAASKGANRLGKVHRHFDEAGLVVYTLYNFKNNVVDRVRRVIRDDVLAAVFPTPSAPAPDWHITPLRIDWHPPAGMSLAEYADTVLDGTGYETSAAYDALDRVTHLNFPADITGRRSELRQEYNKAGGLERIELDGKALVTRIAYNAAGQRTLVALGNGILSRYAFDDRSRRLRRLRTERYTEPGPFIYRPVGPVLQDRAYAYDLAGNMREIVDRTPGCGVRGNPEAGLTNNPQLRALVAAGDALIRRFQYDSLYRLVGATGRECTGGQGPQPWRDDPRCGSPGTIASPTNAAEVTHGYSEAYQYDAIGNLTSLRHTDGDTTVVRQFALVPGNNRLKSLTMGQTVVAYTFDPKGNLASETNSRHFEWDHSDRLKSYRTQAGGAEPSVYVQYLYDAAGQRVKKLTRRQGGQIESITYLDGMFEHHLWESGGVPGANNYLHVMDGDERIAILRQGPAHPGDSGPAVQYPLGDHLGSSSVVLDASGGFVNGEEYTPYGESSFGSFGRKRYRFTSKERDEESGMYYHSARYYAPWLGRWISADPKVSAGGLNSYRYCRDRPNMTTDAEGTMDRETKEILNRLQQIISDIPQDEFESLTRPEQGTRAHLTLESILTTDAKSPAFVEGGVRLAPEVILDTTGKIVDFGEPGKARKGYRTIDVALLKQPVADVRLLRGKYASEVIEAAIDYKTGSSKLGGVADMQDRIKAPYIKAVQGGDIVADLEAKIARMAKASVSTGKSGGARSAKALAKKVVMAIPFADVAVQQIFHDELTYGFGRAEDAALNVTVAELWEVPTALYSMVELATMGLLYVTGKGINTAKRTAKGAVEAAGVNEAEGRLTWEIYRYFGVRP